MLFSIKYFQTGNDHLQHDILLIMRSSFFESLFKQKITDTGFDEQLHKLITDHPYFSPAQFYLLQHAAENTEDQQKLATKTSILFNNNYWLNFQLLDSAENDHPNTEEKLIFTEEKKEEPVIITQPETPESKNEPVEIKNEVPPNEVKPDSKDGVMIFEPLHTTDYFASQGIKLSEEIKPTDKLGRQMKSFTEWLKTMKKISPEKIQAGHTNQADEAIQTLAEKSNTEDEILTETMAEVLVQQGKREKAVEVYEKLSLSNPSKSAYFAAKIEHLKQK